MATITPDGSVPIGQSISKCKEEIRSILNRLRAFYEPCDLDTARGFTENLIQGLNKVFDDFLVEAFADKTNINTSNNNNNNDNHQVEVTLPASIPIKQENGSDEIYIIESDDDEPKIKVEQESINETEIPLETRSADICDNSINEPGSSNDRSVVKKNSKKVQRKTKIKPSTKCEVCNEEFRSLYGLVYHRQIHLDYLNHFCRMCLESFSSNFSRKLHEEKCKYSRYECYLCSKSQMSLVGLQNHLRVHTEMRSFRIGNAIEKYYNKKNVEMQPIGERSIKKKKLKVMAKAQIQPITVIDLTED